jgi:hypothetical protein
MKTLAVIALLVSLTACTSRSTDQERSGATSNAPVQRREADVPARQVGTNNPYSAEWLEAWKAREAAFQRKRQEAAARAKATGDERPYPEGWVGLPLRRDPRIVDSIRAGQTMTEVAKVMGRSGPAAQISTRQEFLISLHSTYAKHTSSNAVPRDLSGMEKRLPAQGRFAQWRYQGFPATADWIVVFFAAPQNPPDAEPVVVARGIFDLGCF